MVNLTAIWAAEAIPAQQVEWLSVSVRYGRTPGAVTPSQPGVQGNILVSCKVVAGTHAEGLVVIIDALGNGSTLRTTRNFIERLGNR